MYSQTSLARTLITRDGSDDASVDLPQMVAKETTADVQISGELSESQAQEVRTGLKKCEGTLTDLPGKCNIGEHGIKLTSEERPRPYPIPHAWRNTVRTDVKTMLDMRFIELSSVPYTSPIVLVKKPDGSNRLCIDFRKLNLITVFDANQCQIQRKYYQR